MGLVYVPSGHGKRDPSRTEQAGPMQTRTREPDLSRRTPVLIIRRHIQSGQEMSADPNRARHGIQGRDQGTCTCAVSFATDASRFSRRDKRLNGSGGSPAATGQPADCFQYRLLRSCRGVLVFELLHPLLQVVDLIAILPHDLHETDEMSADEPVRTAG